MDKELIKKAFMAGYNFCKENTDIEWLCEMDYNGHSNVWKNKPQIRIWNEGMIDKEIEKFLNTKWGNDECDYCRGKGHYYINNEKCDCFCNDLEE